MNNRLLWAGLALCIAGFFFYARRETPVATVAIAPDGGPVACRVARGDGNPAQTDVLPGVGEFRLGQATVSPLAGFHIEARVLGREDYRSDHEATWSPIDLALGWGRMADPAVYGRLDISQGGRWYRYGWGSEGPPIPPDEIVRSSANMHMVPASDTVARQLAAVRAGDDIRLSGLLVHIRGDDGFQWRSSLTREDSGGGACELIYVCSLEIRSR
jgi:hypothetical protein